MPLRCTTTACRRHARGNSTRTQGRGIHGGGQARGRPAAVQREFDIWAVDLWCIPAAAVHAPELLQSRGEPAGWRTTTYMS